MPSRKFIVGCGYLGHRVARLWLAAGASVVAMTRSRETAGHWGRGGIVPIVADLLDEHPPPAVDLHGQRLLDGVETVLFAVGISATDKMSAESFATQALTRALELAPPDLKRFVLISSTGVYGQTTGGEIDEDSECHPTREGGRACLAAERVLASHALGDRAIVLRLAGIYGPGRVPRIEQLRAGTPIPAPEHGFLNLIHVDDAARVVLAAEQLAAPPRTYVVSDGHPVERREYLAEVARRSGAPPPRFTTPDPATHAAQRAGSDKRVVNRRMLTELQISLLYPSYREGLSTAIA